MSESRKTEVMPMNFSRISSTYERDSLIQKTAAEKLLGLLSIGGHDDVLDVGCGPGNLTRKIRELTEGRVVGVDPSEGMIRQAQEHRDGRILYRTEGVESLAFREEFDVIFCNSAFQWFGDPFGALQKCRQALRVGGRMGIQAPARESYSPTFIKAVAALADDPRTREIFATFQLGLFFLETADDYRLLFERAGFNVPFALIETQKSLHTPDQVYTIFSSGAAAAYLNPDWYQAPLDAAYCAAFREIIRDAFAAQAGKDGKVELVFNRIYLVGING